MIIDFKVQTLNFSDDINELLCRVDSKISGIAKERLDASRYGATICVNWEDFSKLTKYRKILSDKANNSQCLSGYLVDDIISRIKQLLNRN